MRIIQVKMYLRIRLAAKCVAESHVQRTVSMIITIIKSLSNPQFVYQLHIHDAGNSNKGYLPFYCIRREHDDSVTKMRGKYAH